MSFPYLGVANAATRTQRARITKIANAQPKRVAEQSKPTKGTSWKPYDQTVDVPQGFKPAVSFERGV